MGRVGAKGGLHPPGPVRGSQAKSGGEAQPKQAEDGVSEVSKSHTDSLPARRRAIDTGPVRGWGIDQSVMGAVAETPAPLDGAEPVGSGGENRLPMILIRRLG